MDEKKISKERFLYCKENIGLLNVMLHEADKYKTIIKDDPVLTVEIEVLSNAVRRFENLTGLKLYIE